MKSTPTKTPWLRENRGFLLFLLCFGVFRTAIADWNPVPSGSMRPTILEGDVVLVNRLAYDAKLPLTDIRLLPIAEPQRGDVLTFSSPADGSRLIKRLVAGPGDRVEMRGNVLSINGQAAVYQPGDTVLEPVGAWVLGARRSTEQIAGGSRQVQTLEGIQPHDFGPLRVPAGHYFMLGDNRDNSADSRVFGPVPRRLLIGRAHHILVSADLAAWGRPRWERIAAAIR